MEGGVGREGLDLHPSPRGPAGERGGTRLSASKSRLTIPGRSRVRGHPYTAPPVEMEQAPTSRPACRCKNRKANPGTRPTAYYFGHRNATALRPVDQGTRVCFTHPSLSLFLSLLVPPGSLLRYFYSPKRGEEKRCNESKTVAIDSYLAPWMQRWANKWNAGLRREETSGDEARIFELASWKGVLVERFLFSWCQEGFRHLQQGCVSRIHI